MHDRRVAWRRMWLALMLTALMALGGCRKGDKVAVSQSAAAREQARALAEATERVDELTRELAHVRQGREQQEARIAALAAEAEQNTARLADARRHQTQYGWIAVGAGVGGMVLFLLGTALGASASTVNVPSTSRQARSLQGGADVEA